MKLNNETQIKFMVYDLTTERPVPVRDACSVGSPEIYFTTYEDAEKELNKDLSRFPNHHILTIVEVEIKIMYKDVLSTPNLTATAQ